MASCGLFSESILSSFRGPATISISTLCVGVCRLNERRQWAHTLLRHALVNQYQLDGMLGNECVDLRALLKWLSLIVSWSWDDLYLYPSRCVCVCAFFFLR